MLPDAVLAALGHLWKTLERLQVPAAVMGGVALAAWNHLRATKDVDVLVGISEQDLDPVLAALQATGIHPKRSPPLAQLGEVQVVQLLYEPPDAFVELQLDLFVASSAFFQQALARRTPLTLPQSGFELQVISCEDLILMKLQSGRILDRADAGALIRINHGELDRVYLRSTADQIQLLRELSEIWRQTVPDAPAL